MTAVISPQSLLGYLKIPTVGTHLPVPWCYGGEQGNNAHRSLTVWPYLFWGKNLTLWQYSLLHGKAFDLKNKNSILNVHHGFLLRASTMGVHLFWCLYNSFPRSLKLDVISKCQCHYYGNWGSWVTRDQWWPLNWEADPTSQVGGHPRSTSWGSLERRQGQQEEQRLQSHMVWGSALLHSGSVSMES